MYIILCVCYSQLFGEPDADNDVSPETVLVNDSYNDNDG